MGKIFSITAATLAFMLISADRLQAKTVEMGYKTGQIIAAEMTSASMDITGREQSPCPNNFKNPRYVQVMLKMHPRRSISVVDYSLVINNVTAGCIAMASNQEPFVSAPTVLSPDPRDVVKMLFVFDGARVKGPGANKTLRAVLKSNIRARGSLTINVTDLGSGKFTDPGKVPAAGLLK